MKGFPLLQDFWTLAQPQTPSVGRSRASCSLCLDRGSAPGVGTRGPTLGRDLQVTQLCPHSTPARKPRSSYLVLLSAVDAASLTAPLGVAVYLALVAGFRGEQVVFILLLGSRKVGTFPKTQARNTVSGGRKAERPVSDWPFKKEIIPLPPQGLHEAPRNTRRILPVCRTRLVHGTCLREIRPRLVQMWPEGLICLHPGLAGAPEHLLQRWQPRSPLAE